MTSQWSPWNCAHFSVKHAFGRFMHGSSWMFSYDKGAIFCPSSFPCSCKVFSEISQCRVMRLAHSILGKTDNPKNDDLSDKSASYRAMQELFNNVFDTKQVISLVVSLSVSWTLWFILRQMFRGGLTFWVVFI